MHFINQLIMQLLSNYKICSYHTYGQSTNIFHVFKENGRKHLLTLHACLNPLILLNNAITEYDMLFSVLDDSYE
jgi:hypothetical protein